MTYSAGRILETRRNGAGPARLVLFEETLMKKIVLVALGAGLMSLAACNSKADEAVEQNREAMADNMQAVTDNTEAAAEAADDAGNDTAEAVLENKAEAQQAATDNAEDHADDTTDSN
ncbi:hypothetical protein [Sphingomonas bacterium]|uniref:hypothetical protein n=1 Tax=Sphingomonas bacterium TaxID=1895847 RepID=UPI00260D3949|nr:hypothetical protein [Sphingomonas bacterium]